MKTTGWIALWAVISYGLSLALMISIVKVGVTLTGGQ